MKFAPQAIEAYEPWWEVFHHDFCNMPWREANKFIPVFVDGIPRRLEVLQSLVRSTEGFESWTADLSDESLVELGRWVPFGFDHETVQGGGLRWLKKDYPPPDVREAVEREEAMRVYQRFTERSDGIEFDIGLYVGEWIRACLPAATWKRCTRKYRECYNRPWLISEHSSQGFMPWGNGGFGHVGAYGIYFRGEEPDRLLFVAKLRRSTVRGTAGLETQTRR